MKNIIIYIVLILALFNSYYAFAQTNHSNYFKVSANDINRWNEYSKFIESNNLSDIAKADTIFNFAKIEYEKGQFSKARELSEKTLELNPQFAEAHQLIGNSYIATITICEDKKRKPPILRDFVIWAAMDEWEKAAILGDETSKNLIKKYNPFIADERMIRSCFEDRIVEEGDEILVGCWIQRKAKVRFRK